MTITRTHRAVNILLADDGSEHALSAINLTRDLPLSNDSNVFIVGVLIPRESSNHAVLSAVLEHSKNMLEGTGVQIETELVLGYPQEKIIEYAGKWDPDLIIIGAKGLRATLGILLGGVAQQVVEYAHCPVLVVRAPYTGLQRIAIVTDGSSFSNQAIEYISGRPGISGKGGRALKATHRVEIGTPDQGRPQDCSQADIEQELKGKQAPSIAPHQEMSSCQRHHGPESNHHYGHYKLSAARSPRSRSRATGARLRVPGVA